jgi:hypothetical protein
VSFGGPVEKVSWPASEANAVSRMNDKKNLIFGLSRRGILFLLKVPIYQPPGSINRSFEDVKDAWKLFLTTLFGQLYILGMVS